ncbi:MAG: hypothetical protein RLZZ244_2823 [Verrucomicrobiota bacterium]
MAASGSFFTDDVPRKEVDVRLPKRLPPGFFPPNCDIAIALRALRPSRKPGDSFNTVWMSEVAYP